MYSLSKLNVIIFVIFIPFYFWKKHTYRETWNLASLQISFKMIKNWSLKKKYFHKNIKKPITYYWKRILKKIITPECTVMMPLTCGWNICTEFVNTQHIACIHTHTHEIYSYIIYFWFESTRNSLTTKTAHNLATFNSKHNTNKSVVRR